MPGIATVSFTGTCWRAVPTGRRDAVLVGSDRPGRYNRPGSPALYMSASMAGAEAAMARYADAPRAVIPLHVAGAQLFDLRDSEIRAGLSVDDALARQDWLAMIDRGEVPGTWLVADRVRSLGADGLIDPSRRLPGACHLVLFRWNRADCPTVAVINAA